MRNDQRRAVLGDPVELVLNVLFGMAVERRGGFVKQQDRRALEDRGRDGDALLLAAGKLQSALADLRFITLRRAADETVDLGLARRLLDVGVACIPASVTDVVTDRIVK